MAARVDLTTGSVERHILRMLAPFWVAILALMSSGVVDTIYLGRLSTDALAAVGFCFPIIFLGNSVNIGLGAGTLSAISRDLGRKRYEEARTHGASAIILTIVIMVALCILGWLGSALILDLMGATHDVKPLSQVYLKYTLPALVFMGIGMMCNNMLRASGEAVLPSMIMISGAVINIIIDPMLIFGIGPFPRLEIKGAAIGTLIASVFTASFGFYLVKFHRKAANFAGLTKAKILTAWKIIGRVGIPAMGTNIVVPLAGFSATTIIARTLGKTEVAAFTVVGRTEMIAVALLYALSACIGANTGQNGGAGLTDRVKRAFTFSYLICLVWGAIIAIPMWVFAEHIPAIYSKDPAVIALATAYFKIVPVTLAGYGLVFVSAAGLNGLGRPHYGLVYTIIRSLVLYIGFIWIGAVMAGMIGVYVGIALANVVSGLIAYLYTTFRVPMSVISHD
ncbi:MAG TPA: MATE family efflux transporter [Hellea balneolensis]|uniref:MATE family efflux transporter n=1 Tax=Hellea balneolensis TaxID=287478 RepID=A0A7C5R023_9PROT|nr:MATE family efflux transporter [Hellea balneolensis]